MDICSQPENVAEAHPQNARDPLVLGRGFTSVLAGRFNRFLLF